MSHTKEEYTKMFKEEVTDRAEEVDESQSHDWHSLTIGWALAKGMSPEDANDFATYIRYDTNLG